ncbi:hypothetical protein ACIHFD_49740 [Nonomuraea sp. NPDC051941]|uniref:hypothetical protein n=1 Tax=Nonomuraea sp. NPDC051941 TaxID=3364373 RepID=UPI0037C85036
MAERLAEALQRKGLSDRAAARALKRAGVSATHAYVGQLRKGDATNPSLEIMTGLAQVLDVTVGWLAGDEPPEPPLSPEEQAQIERIRQGVSSLRVQNIAERMTGLKKDFSLDAVEQMVETMLAAEGRHPDEDEI